MTLTVSDQHFNEGQLQLLKNTICRGSTDEEFQLFAHACRKTGLDPFMKQIYAVKRWDSGLKRQVMTIQVGIDGLRAIADKTGAYAPGRKPAYTYDANGKLVAATAYVKKRTRDGKWHEIEAEAFYAEYVATKKDGEANSFWETKPHIMLSKCAEALALRKAFPYELSGLYTTEEMMQADNGKTAQPISLTTVEVGEDQIDVFIAETKLTKDQVEGYIEFIAKAKNLTREQTYASVVNDAGKFADYYKMWSEKQT
jgi:phage recombination protein Bet